MIPKDLKIGDTFEEETLSGPVRFKVVGFDAQGNYISELAKDENVVPVEELVEEELPFTEPDDEIDEVQPVVEEAKEKKPVKKTVKRKTTAKKTSKK